MLLSFSKLRKKDNKGANVNNLLNPLNKWEQKNRKITEEQNERLENLENNLSMIKLQLDKAKKRSLDNKAKGNDVGNPNHSKADPTNKNVLHGDKSDCHNDGHGAHDAQLCFPGHSLAPNKCLQIIFVKLSPLKPGIQPLRTSGKAKSGYQ